MEEPRVGRSNGTATAAAAQAFLFGHWGCTHQHLVTPSVGRLIRTFEVACLQGEKPFPFSTTYP
jgi:hypothetical protein